jgi:hypothetical protein
MKRVKNAKRRRTPHFCPAASLLVPASAFSCLVMVPNVTVIELMLIGAQVATLNPVVDELGVLGGCVHDEE